MTPQPPAEQPEVKAREKPMRGYSSALDLIRDQVADPKNDGSYTLSLNAAMTLELWQHVQELQEARASDRRKLALAREALKEAKMALELYAATCNDSLGAPARIWLNSLAKTPALSVLCSEEQKDEREKG